MCKLIINENYIREINSHLAWTHKLTRVVAGIETLRRGGVYPWADTTRSAQYINTVHETFLIFYGFP